MGLCASVGPAPFLAGLALDNHLVGGIHEVGTAMGSAGPMGSHVHWCCSFCSSSVAGDTRHARDDPGGENGLGE